VLHVEHFVVPHLRDLEDLGLRSVEPLLVPRSDGLHHEGHHVLGLRLGRALGSGCRRSRGSRRPSDELGGVGIDFSERMMALCWSVSSSSVIGVFRAPVAGDLAPTARTVFSSSSNALRVRDVDLDLHRADLDAVARFELGAGDARSVDRRAVGPAEVEDLHAAVVVDVDDGVEVGERRIVDAQHGSRPATDGHALRVELFLSQELATDGDVEPEKHLACHPRIPLFDRGSGPAESARSRYGDPRRQTVPQGMQHCCALLDFVYGRRHFLVEIGADLDQGVERRPFPVREAAFPEA
jgi:hypothetical protein